MECRECLQDETTHVCQHCEKQIPLGECFQIERSHETLGDAPTGELLCLTCSVVDQLGTRCAKCGAYHDEKSGAPNAAVFRELCEKHFDPAKPCRICELPVGAMSMGGPDICPACDAGHQRRQPPEGALERFQRLVEVVARVSQ